MSIITCGQQAVIPDECPFCGFVGPRGWLFCYRAGAVR